MGRLLGTGHQEVARGDALVDRAIRPVIAVFEERRQQLIVDEEFGKRLRAFVVLADGQEVSEEELREHVKANLARYKVPRDFVFLDELPRNATGKVLKRELATADGGE